MLRRRGIFLMTKEKRTPTVNLYVHKICTLRWDRHLLCARIARVRERRSLRRGRNGLLIRVLRGRRLYVRVRIASVNGKLAIAWETFGLQNTESETLRVGIDGDIASKVVRDPANVKVTQMPKCTKLILCMSGTPFLPKALTAFLTAKAAWPAPFGPPFPPSISP